MSGKKLLIIGVVITLLATIPLTVYFLQQEQDVRSSAAPATRLYYTPQSTTKNVGEAIPLDIMVDPGTNQISFVKLLITYDQTKMSTNSANTTCGNALCVDTAKFPAVIEGPIYTPGSISVTLSVGANPINVIQAVTKIGTLTLRADAPTTGGATAQVAFGSQTQVLSIASSDQPSENVLASSTPASVTIGGSAATPTPTTGPTAVPAANIAPVCTAFNVDRSTTGVAPYSLTFTAIGTDTTPGTISKATFNFGDGVPQDVTQAGGIGTNSVSVQIAHTYSNPGTFNAYAILTDNQGAVSSPSACAKTITVTQASGSAQIGSPTGTPSATATPTTAAPTNAPSTPIPTIAASGPSGNLFSIGLLGAVASIVGGLIFFSL